MLEAGPHRSFLGLLSDPEAGLNAVMGVPVGGEVMGGTEKRIGEVEATGDGL